MNLKRIVTMVSVKLHVFQEGVIETLDNCISRPMLVLIQHGGGGGPVVYL